MQELVSKSGIVDQKSGPHEAGECFASHAIAVVKPLFREIFDMIDRSAVAQALAKAIAYKNCGKDNDAAQWATRLVRLLECADILKGGL